MPGLDQFTSNGPAWTLVGFFLLGFVWVGKFVRDVFHAMREDSKQERLNCQEVNRGLLAQQERLADSLERLTDDGSKKKTEPWSPRV